MKFKKIFKLIFCLFFIYFDAHSIENRILFKINNEIITSIDLEIEKNYLITLNPNLRELDGKKIDEIAKSSIIKEKVKKLEIEKIFKQLEIENKYLDPIIENTYKKAGFTNYEEFLKILDQNNLNLDIIKKKITLEVLWNQLIFSKYNSKVIINEEELKKEIIKESTSLKSYLISEIIFENLKNENLNETFEKIKNSIKINGFENTALEYSISDSSRSGGKIGWVQERSLNKNIRDEINKIDIGDHTNPILIPSGFLILKLNDIKKYEQEIDIAKELNSRIQIAKNQQLNQYSNIYFNKVKKDIKIEKL